MAIGVARSVLVQQAVDEEGLDVFAIALHHTEHSPMVLARFLGIVGHQTQPVRTQIIVDRQAFQSTPEKGSVFDLLESLESHGVDTDAAHTVALLMASRRATWRVMSVTSGVEDASDATDADRETSAIGRSRYLCGIDAGSGGLWTIDVNERAVTISPVTAREMYERLVDLFPRDRF
jgi:spore maturation protein SpmB